MAKHRLVADAFSSQASARTVHLTPHAARVLVYGLLLLQCIQPALTRPLQFVQSYWLVDYGSGFVRRGLGGTVLGWFSNPLTIGAIDITLVIVASTALAAAVILVELLLRAGGASATYLAILLVSSPFLFDQLLLHRRPNEIGVFVLILLAFALLRAPAGNMVALSAIGVAFATTTFVHEGTFLYYGGFAVMLTLVVTRRIPPAVAVGLPSVLALVVVVLAGRATDAQTAAFAAQAPPELVGATDMYMDYMTDTLRVSIMETLGFGLTRQAVMILVGLALVAIHVHWLRTRVGTVFFDRSTFFDRPATLNPIVLRASLVLWAGSVLVVFLTGSDWIRWFCNFGGAWLICIATLVLIDRGRARETSPTTVDSGVRIPVKYLLLAVYLASLAPLPAQLNNGHLVLYWVPFFTY